MYTINHMRYMRDLSLGEVASAMGISESYCSLLLGGHRRMSFENAWKLSKILSVSLEELYESYVYTRKCVDGNH